MVGEIMEKAEEEVLVNNVNIATIWNMWKVNAIESTRFLPRWNKRALRH